MESGLSKFVKRMVERKRKIGWEKRRKTKSGRE